MDNCRERNPPSTKKGTTWYKQIDNLAHKVEGMQTLNVLLLAWVISSGGVSFNNAILDNNNVYSQMHALPYDGTIGAPPAHWASMDWVMTAKRVMSGSSISYVGGAVSHELCLDGDKNCNPEFWQTHKGCTKDPAMQLLIPPSVIDEQAYFYRSTRTKYRHLQPMFTCLAEKIGDVAVYQNNEHSYSIGSTHNANVLVAAVFMICAVIFATMLIVTMRRQVGQETTDKEYVKRMILTGLVIFYLGTTYIYASSIASDSNKDQHRPIGMASYAYSTVFLLASLFIFNRSGILRDNALEFDRMSADPNEEVPVVYPAQPEDAVEGALGYAPPQYPGNQVYPEPGSGVKEDSRMNVPMSTLNVRRFVQEPTHYDTRIKMPFIVHGPAEQDATPAKQNTVTVDVCELISNPVHSRFVYGQLLTLPLALMALCMHGKNYGLDTYTQVVFVCALVYCLVDVFLYRMWWAFQIHKGVTFYQEDDVGEYRAMEVLTILCLFLQITTFIFFIVSELFDKSYMWFFVVHLILTSIAKLVGTMAIRQHKQIFDYAAAASFPRPTSMP